VDQAQRNSRIIYPKLPATLTEDELRLLFTIKSDEWAWARTVARRSHRWSGRRRLPRRPPPLSSRTPSLPCYPSEPQSEITRPAIIFCRDEGFRPLFTHQ
jgi:hypothetical protein